MIQLRILPHVERTMAPLLFLAVSMTSLAGCGGPDDTHGPNHALAVTPGSVTLTYICGNSFRVRNTNTSMITVTWDVYQTAETGSLALPSKPANAPYSETYFTTVNKGTVRLFESGALVQTKANGNKPACAIPTDSTPPSIPPGAGLPSRPTRLVSPPEAPESSHYRDYIAIGFDSSTSGVRIREVFSKYAATVVGGVPNLAGVTLYYINVPDPGQTWSDLLALKQRLSDEPGVRTVILLEFGAVPIQRGRYPEDSLTAPSRASWFTTASGARWQPTINSFNAVRAPLAWGCETGQYGGSAPSIAMLDYFYDGALTDLEVVHRVQPGQADLDSTSQRVFSSSERDHGFAVASLAAAFGNNGVGTAGMVWGAPLRLHAFATGNKVVSNYLRPLYDAINDADANGVRILSLSVTFARPKQPEAMQETQRAFEWFLKRSPQRIIVFALPELKPSAGVASSLTSVASGQAPRVEAFDQALAALAIKPEYSKRILFVAATEALTGNRWPASDVWTGGSTIAAPGDAILTPAISTPDAAWSGTSFSQPMVSGAAALLWTMSPGLTGAEVVDYLLGGASADRDDPATGSPVPVRDIGVPGVYQLDAYGSLKLLAGEHPETPICGFPVVTRRIQDPVSGAPIESVLLQRPGSIEKEIYRGDVQSVTVAQGGRIIGIDAGWQSRNLVFQFGEWSTTSWRPLAGYRQFLEVDTAVVTYGLNPTDSVWIKGPSGSRGPFVPCDNGSVGRFFPSSVRACRLGPVASSSEWVHVISDGNNLDVTGCGTGMAGYGSYLVSLRGANSAPRILREVPYDPCFAENVGQHTVPAIDVLAWRSDGAVAWVGQSSVTFDVTRPLPTPADPYPYTEIRATDMITVFSQHSVASGVPTLPSRSVQHRLSNALGWKVDGASLISQEFTDLELSACERVVRAGNNPQISPSNSPISYCANTPPEPMPATVRVAGARADLEPRGGNGAPAANRPVSAVEARLQELRRPAVQGMVLVN
jgi:hypothetical protein